MRGERSIAWLFPTWSSNLLVLATAMATEAPDPRTFQSWEDAFQYPIPVVRKLEQQLRSNADDNREKLRSLVGCVQGFRPSKRS
jgi:hypothetical protein